HRHNVEPWTGLLFLNRGSRRAACDNENVGSESGSIAMSRSPGVVRLRTGVYLFCRIAEGPREGRSRGSSGEFGGDLPAAKEALGGRGHVTGGTGGSADPAAGTPSPWLEVSREPAPRRADMCGKAGATVVQPEPCSAGKGIGLWSARNLDHHRPRSGGWHVE